MTACEGGLGKEEKSAAGSVHRAGANKLRSRVKGAREGPLLELLSPARRIDTSFPTRRRVDDERHTPRWPLSGVPLPSGCVLGTRASGRPCPRRHVQLPFSKRFSTAFDKTEPRDAQAGYAIRYRETITASVD